MFKLINVDPHKIEKMNVGINVFKKISLKDDRGLLNVNYENEISSNSNFISIKNSISKPMVGRGLHHQINPFGQKKIISVEKGKILDFSFDTTKNEKIIYGIYLDEKMEITLSFPETFAHGFITLTETKFNYVCIGNYNEKAETVYNLLPSIGKKMKLGKIIQSKKDFFSPVLKVSI